MAETLAVASLRRRVIRAAGWTVGGHAARQGLRLVSSLVMTRLLLPEAFGVMAVAGVLMTGLALFSDFGLRQHIVHSRRGDDPAFLNTVWTLQILRGALIWLLALGGGQALALLQRLDALPAGSVYADPRLPAVIAVVSAAALIAGFESTKLATANRRLLLGRQTLLEIGSQAAGLLAMLAWASLDRSLWALVAGGLAAALARTAMSHALLPGARNRLAWDAAAARQVFGFGRWILLSSLLGFLVANGDRLLLAGLLPPATLGLYAIAFLAVNSVHWAILNLVVNVSFPALSEVARSDPARLAAAYYRLRLPLDAMALFAAGFLCLAGPRLVELLYDPRYAGAGRMLQILAFDLVAVPFFLADQFALALGQPQRLFVFNLLRAAALYVLLPLSFHLAGLEGALWAIALSPLASLPATLHFKRRHGILDAAKELRAWPAFALGVAGAALFARLWP